jgi:prolyl oligopeptidase PreP (S9A serine peptidase family)
VLLDVELNSGHGGSQTTFRAIGLYADIYTFLARNLAMQSR